MATVLIVEYEDVLRETLSSFLSRQGHDVIAAASGYEALEVGLDALPDVLVADWMLKNQIHGLHVSAVFRALHLQLNTILITGFPSRDLLEESDRCGIARLLEKPFDLKDFDDAVSSALATPNTATDLSPGIAAIAVDPSRAIQFASRRAQELFAAAKIPATPRRISEVIEGDALERDGVVRRLLVAQIERAGALCYPSEDLKSALRLLRAEPRVRSVMVDFALADGAMASWVAQIRAERPDVQPIGTGGVGAESDLLAEGVSRVLRKPWRINDLIDALDH